MRIKEYSNEDETRLFELMRDEGYFEENVLDGYRRPLKSSRAYVAYEGNVLCGFARCRDDDGFGVYIYDLLVKTEFRGHGLGRKLMERVCEDFPEVTVYVMSDVDAYYEKLGYRREGSIFKVSR